MLLSCGSSDSFPSSVNPLTSPTTLSEIGNTAKIPDVTKVPTLVYLPQYNLVSQPDPSVPQRRLLSGGAGTYRAVFLVVAASVLALASRMEHHWYLKVSLLSMGCRTVH